MAGVELKSCYKVMKWKLKTEKWGIMLQVVIDQSETLKLGWGGDNNIFIDSTYYV